ncbi:MAG: ACP S-malonyltransferase [Clostridiales bacterium]|nr:ACP S-malonyltransferase [Clostridiales bacterium]
MGQIAFVFSGQGAQYSGMGQSLCQASGAARAVFAAVDAIRPGTSEQCFTGSKEELSITSNTQPCMFAVELAAARALEEAGIRPSRVAGFSLGEIAALTYAGAVSLEDGFQLVCRRGALMQQAAEAADTGMLAVLKLDNETVEALCSQQPEVYPVNYNCPGQVTVAGLKTSLAALKDAVKAAGGRAVPLAVSGGFHSPFMAPAAQQLEQVLSQMQISAPQIPLYSNYTAQLYEGDYRMLLRQQVCNPVRWQDIVEDMVRQGVDTFIEVGPGKTLCGLIAKTVPTARTWNVESAETLQAVINEVN